MGAGASPNDNGMRATTIAEQWYHSPMVRELSSSRMLLMMVKDTGGWRGRAVC